MTVAFITHPDCMLHDMGAAHPESPARLQAINDQLIASGLEWLLQHYDAPKASLEQLQRVHDADYIQTIFDRAPQTGLIQIDQDTSMNPYSLNAALYAAGAVVLGVDLVMAGTIDVVFCSIRPPGHHAGHNRAMGLCFFNNIAVAAAHALAEYDLQRIAIVDFDVHHGNGTEDIFRDHPKVLLCSVFQHPLYPYGESQSSNANIVYAPLSPNSGSDDFQKAISEIWLPALHAFEPQLILCSAGFDGHRDDEV
ncbi:MAG: histone deacetylase family protein, partial [Gammaproteobacteria bacterium]|nr:histone deacetylase family protein [Gammaproteobacteria bacterium]